MRAVLIGVVFLVTTLTLTTPLIDKVLSDQVINTLENGVDNIEFFVGSENTNTFLVMIAVLLIFTIYRRAGRFFHSND